MKRDIFRIVLAFILASAGFSYAETNITTPFVGITCTQRSEVVPRLLNINVVEIDLQAAGLGFYVTPGNGDFVSGETTPQNTQAFLEQKNAQLAFNAHFFGYVTGGGVDLYGAAYSNGYPVSTFSPSWPTLGITQSNQADTYTQFPTAYGALYNAIAGNALILTNGVNTAPTDDTLHTYLHPRTAVGLSADKKKMVIMTVDGRQTGISLGVSTKELGYLIAEYGVYNAINLDGGGSTQLAINNSEPHYANTPSEAPRAVGSNMAVFATPIYAAAGQTPSLIAYEDFSYERCTPGHTGNTTPDSGGLSALLGGSGWAGGWKEAQSKDEFDGYIYAGIATYETTADVSGNKTALLNYTDMSGRTLVTQGAQMRTSFGGCSVTNRYVDVSKVGVDMIKDGQIGANGSEVWVSFLAQSYGTNDYSEAFIQLGDGVRFGMLKNNKWGIQDSQNQTIEAFSQIDVGDSAMFLAKLLFLNGQDRVQVWLNPSLAGVGDLGAPDIDVLVSDFTFSSVNVIGTYSTDFDELRIGTTYQAVTPASVPEPVTMMMTSLGFLTLQYCKNKRGAK